MNQTPTTQSNAPTASELREILHEALVTHRETIAYDPRYEIVRELTSVFERHSDMMESMARSLQWEIDRNRVNGLRGVGSSLKTSHWDDLPKLAAQIQVLRSILDSTTKSQDDPEATAMDRLIHQILPQ